MRNLILIFVMASISFLFVNCSGDGSETEISQQDETTSTTSQSDIRSVIDSTWEALSAQDLERFNQYVSSEWRLFTERGNKMNAGNLLKTHQNNLTDFNLDYSNLEINVHDSVAWATYDATMSGQWQGEDWGGEFIFTNILVRENGEWKIVHMHESEKEEARSGAETD